MDRGAAPPFLALSEEDEVEIEDVDDDNRIDWPALCFACLSFHLISNVLLTYPRKPWQTKFSQTATRQSHPTEPMALPSMAPP